MELSETEIEKRENGQDDSKRYAYVIEGVTDEDKLKKLGCLFVIKTGGKYIRPEIMTFLEEVHKVRELVIITDPDGPGRDIENRIMKRVGPCLVAHAEKKKAIYNDKVGVAEMKKEDLKELLKPFIRHDLFCDERLSLEDDDFYDLGLVGPGSKEKRMKLVNKYHLPYTSAKNVEDAMLMLAKTKEDILKDIQDD